MSNPVGGRQPWRGGGEPPQVQHDFGAETAPPETGPPGTGRTDGGGGAGDQGTRLADLEARLAEAEDQRLRAVADLANLRRRCAAQVERAEADARTQVARQWLPVVDNLERALEHAEADPRTIVEGIRAVRQQALGVLASLGFPRRDDTGATFDPVRHEAIAATYDPRVPPGTVVQVVRPGYGEPDRLLRPAQVVVAKAD
jgi:molecular chaperone GrpE